MKTVFISCQFVKYFFGATQSQNSNKFILLKYFGTFWIQTKYKSISATNQCVQNAVILLQAHTSLINFTDFYFMSQILVIVTRDVDFCFRRYFFHMVIKKSCCLAILTVLYSVTNIFVAHKYKIQFAVLFAKCSQFQYFQQIHKKKIVPLLKIATDRSSWHNMCTFYFHHKSIWFWSNTEN